MKSYALLVFDWDGTLVDSKSLFIEAIQKTATIFGYQAPTIATISQYFGSSLEPVLRQFFPQEKHQTQLANTFYHYFTEERLATNFFAGALDTLNYLKQQGFLLAIATNKSRPKLEASLTAAQIKNLFAATRCPEDSGPKPAPQMLLTLLEELKLTPHQALMIGDTILDMQLAQNAAVDALAVCYGCHTKEQLALFKPVGFIENIQELKYILLPS